MTRVITLLIGLVLAGGLSCALPPPAARLDSKVPRDAAVESKAKSAADEIEALLARHLTGLAPFEVRRAAESLITEAHRNGVEPALVLAVMHTESGYYNWSRSSVGALGLMQIMPATGKMLARDLDIPWTGPDMLFEPTLNLRLGTLYLARLHGRYGTWTRALAAYNWGPGEIDRRLAEGEVLPAQYSDRVYARMARK